jgi:hypothetical protein
VSHTPPVEDFCAYGSEAFSGEARVDDIESIPNVVYARHTEHLTVNDAPLGRRKKLPWYRRRMPDQAENAKACRAILARDVLAKSHAIDKGDELPGGRRSDGGEPVGLQEHRGNIQDTPFFVGKDIANHAAGVRFQYVIGTQALDQIAHVFAAKFADAKVAPNEPATVI